MKQIIVTILLSLLADNPTDKQPDKFLILINQDQREHPIASSIDYFWKNSRYFDTIQITGKSLTNQFNSSIDKFTIDTTIIDLSYEVAMIRFNKNIPVDTFYGWRWFNYWKKGDKFYFDTTKQLRSIFLKTFHTQWD
jgi:hypothetical protein